ncbi:MAG: diaminopimelate epimerase [Thermoanaerobaculia bacterium]
MSGAGNDFVVVDNRSGAVRDPSTLARKLCTRRLSVGADGLILIESSARATFRMRYFNADGSLADFCANGTRCAARFALLNVIASRRMTIETGAAVVPAEVVDQRVTLSISPPSGFEAIRPLAIRSGREIRGSFLRVGVPHYVIFVREGLWERDIDALGREIRHHPDLQPDGANVNFVTIRGRNDLDIRTWERGVEAETLACGSGVVASVSVSAISGRVESPVRVRTRSGVILTVTFSGGSSADGPRIGALTLSGDARVVYRGVLLPEATEGFDPEWVAHPTENVLES